MPENTTNGESEKQSFSPLTSTFYSRYTWLSVVSVIPAAVAVFMGSEDLGYMIDVTAAALIVIFFGITKYSLLKKREISLDMMIKNEKALDSRLMGSLGDIGGIGSTVAAVAGIAYAFINLYVRDGGVFSSGDFYIPLLNISSKAISIGTLLACITSKESISASLYIIAGRTFKASGKELIKKACRVTHSTAHNLIIRGNNIGHLYCQRHRLALQLHSAGGDICADGGSLRYDSLPQRQELHRRKAFPLGQKAQVNVRHKQHNVRDNRILLYFQLPYPERLQQLFHC